LLLNIILHLARFLSVIGVYLFPGPDNQFSNKNTTIMTRNILLIAFLTMTMIGCGKKTAYNYSQKLVSIEQSLIPDITETQRKLDRYLTNQQFDSAAAVSQQMEGKIDLKINEAEALPAPDVEEGENFKKAYLKYFAYIKQLYTGYKNFAMQTTEEAREQARQEVIKVEDGKQQAVADMRAAQSKYAKANGFRVEEK
jgi:hypothetical protein